jgi:hypothetical protein
MKTKIIISILLSLIGILLLTKTDFIAINFVNFCELHSIDAGHISSIICTIVALSYWNVFKNWKNSRSGSKWLACSSVYAAITLDLISIIRLLLGK